MVEQPHAVSTANVSEQGTLQQSNSAYIEKTTSVAFKDYQQYIVVIRRETHIRADPPGLASKAGYLWSGSWYTE